MAGNNNLNNISSSSTACWNYDVFISFRGEDTRKNFIDHLYTCLVQANIHTYKDDEELPRGKETSDELQKVIQESRSSIVVFSKNYASSRWCLDELLKILDCREAKGQLVFPVFYDVDPSDVRKQKRSVAEALAEHEKLIGNEVEKIEKWRKALTEAANLSGWDICSVENKNKSMFIQKIVEEVVHRLDHTYLDVAVYPVGIDSRVEKVLSLLGIGSKDVRMIGVCGMGGIGKTAIAKAIYNQVFHLFEGYCFLANVREVAQSFNGLVVLQKELLSKVLKKKCDGFSNAAEGVNLINRRLQARRVFIVIDDVDHPIQLNTLARSYEWFGSGSRIVITTRDEHLLDEFNVHSKYKVHELATNESLELFSWHAFRKTFPTKEYKDLSRDVIYHTRGLPLALEILGSYLFERTVLEWESAIEKLKQIPDKQIQEKLKISFDGLDDKAKETFLDISCFFIGMEKEYVIKILDSRGFYPRITISILTSKFLLNVDESNKLRMHDLVRDMGRDIIRQESPKKPGKRSRLWFYKDVCDTLVKHEGTGAIEGISLVLPELMDEGFSTESFAKMDNLQLLQINHVHLHGSYRLLSKELRWLSWQYCPSTYLPPGFRLDKLVALDMQYSNCKEVWQGKKVLANLMILDLSHSHSLIKTPDFSGVPLLEKLLLECCTGLRRIHHSIGVLNRLVYLNLQGCNNLRRLPNSICRLKVLECLNLTGCVQLNRLPENVGYMESLKELHADGTAIKQLPFSIGFLKNLITMSLQGCNRRRSARSLSSLFSSSFPPRNSDIKRFFPTSISGLQSIKKLVLQNCSLSDGDIPAEIGDLSSLKTLDLTENNLHRLPSSLSQLSNLEFLRLQDSMTLSSLPELPPNLCNLYAYDCISFEKLKLLNLSQLVSVYLGGCNRLREIQGLTSLNFRRVRDLHACGDLAAFKDRFFKGHGPCYGTDFNLPISELPGWFNHQARGQSTSFNMPTDMNNKFLGITLWIVYRAKEVTHLSPDLHAIISDETNGIVNIRSPRLHFVGARITTQDHSWVSHIPRDWLTLPFKGGETINVFVETKLKLEVKKLGIHIVCDGDFEKKVEEDCRRSAT